MGEVAFCGRELGFNRCHEMKSIRHEIFKYSVSSVVLSSRMGLGLEMTGPFHDNDKTCPSSGQSL